MQYLLLLIVTSFPFIAFAQAPNERITQVENGLVKQGIVENREALGGQNIFDRLHYHKVNGASVAVINNNKIEWVKAYGFADNTSRQPVTQETLFQSASIGKVITAIAALHLVKLNKISLDENVNDKLKRWKVRENENTKDEKVTLRRLLSHSAGFADDYGFLGYEPDRELPSILQVLNKEAPSKGKKSIEVKTVPGTVERYSGGGYLIIQLLIEDITGEAFADFIQRIIFEPLQMRHSTYDYKPDIDLGKAIASGHDRSGKNLRGKRYHVYPESAASGPWTTAEDLARFVIHIQREIRGDSDLLLNRKLVQELLTPQINNKGLGVNLKGLEKPEAFWHAGNNLGYVGLLYGVIEKGQGAIVLTNSDGGEDFAQEFITSVANAYQWPVMRSRISMNASNDVSESLIGTYETEDKKTVVVGRNSNGLFLIPHHPRKELKLHQIEQNGFTFANAIDYYKISFNSEAGKITGMKIILSPRKVTDLKKIN